MGDWRGPERSATTVAVFMRPREGGEKAKVNLTGSRLKLSAVENTSKRGGDSTTQAIFIDGDAAVDLQNNEIDIAARNGSEDLGKVKLIAGLSKILDTMSSEQLSALATELQEDCGVCAESDLKFLTQGELDGLKTLRGVQRRKFQSHVRELKVEC